MSNIYVPQKTIEAIETAISSDQGAAYRQNLGRVIPHIGDAYSGDNIPFRSHMGASILGGECSRAIWYSFRWFTRPNFDGRMLRLFNRGHLEEARFIAILLTIGCEVFQQDANGKQFRISHAEGHVGGSGDGIVKNLPDLPGQYALGEFKTHGEKSFLKLEKEGLAVAKPEHLVQMNIYMEKMKIPVGIYMAVNKNTDKLYLELIVADKNIAIEHLELGEYLVYLKQPPKRLNESPGYFKCRFCDHRPVCHLNAEADFNCRTCGFSQPIENAQWVCTHTGEILSKEKQLEGCNSYSRIA